MAGSGLLPLQSSQYMRLVKILFRIKKGLKRGEVTADYPTVTSFQVKIKEEKYETHRFLQREESAMPPI